jgi:6-phosphogluconolactonase
MTDPLRRLGFALVLASSAFASAAEVPVTVYVGTYTDGTSRGIYRTSLDIASGKATAPVLAVEAKNPSFLALHPSGRFLYAVSEVEDFQGAKTGAVMAFAIDPKTGDLTLLNQQPSEGGAPCHLVVDRSGKNLLVANYSGGSVALLRIGSDGRLQPASVVKLHEGQGPNTARQKKPHAHGIYLDAAERFAFAPDLGADRVFVYRFDADKGTLTPHGAAAVAPGSGPRHLAFHPKGRHAYVISELSNTIDVFGYDPAKGELAPIETVKTLPVGFTGKSRVIGPPVPSRPSTTPTSAASAITRAFGNRCAAAM